MNTRFLSIFISVMLFLLFSFDSNGQNSKTKPKKATPKTGIQVIQFHSEHRCYTCNLIEKLTKEALKESYPNVQFLLVNVDDSKNEKIAEEFEASGTALFIYNPATKKKKDMTDYAFMNAKSKPDDFKKGIKAEIEKF